MGVRASKGLREGGVYLLPDGEELIATNDMRGGYLLYTRGVWAAFRGRGPARYDAVSRGEIVTCTGRPTRWRVEDLSDTGRTERPRPLDLGRLEHEPTAYYF
jgi:hypothetical protein